MLLGLATIVMFLLNYVPKVNCELLEIQDAGFQGIINSYKNAISKWPKPNIEEGVS